MSVPFVPAETREREREKKSLLWQFDLTVFGFSCGCSSNMSCTYATMCTLCAGDASTPFERDICEKLASGVFWLKFFKLALRCELFVFVSTDSTTDWYDVYELHCRRQARKVLWNQPGQPTRTPCMLYILLCLYFICFISNLPYNLVQESQGNTSEFTSKLAAYTPGNEARDFFRNNPLPLDPWQGFGPMFLSILSIIFENRRLGGSMIIKLQHPMW